MQDIDAVIVTNNRLSKLQHALDCYDKQTIPFRTIIVVDNNSSDGTAEFLRHWESTKTQYDKHVIFLPNNVGGSGGFYEGEKYAMTLNPDWVYVSDDDAYPEEQLVEKFLNFRVKHQEEKISAICASVWDMTNTIMYGCRNHAEVNNNVFHLFSALQDEYSMPYFKFNCMSYVGNFISGKALQEKGLVNKDFFIYQDDTEHSLRLNQYGLMCCVPDMKVIHDSVPTQQMSHEAVSSILWKEYYAVRNYIYMLFEQNFRIGWNALYTKLSSIHAHHDKSLSPVDKMTLEGCKDACLGRLGIHPIYRPGLDIRTAVCLPYPKYLWKTLYWIFRVKKCFK